MLPFDELNILNKRKKKPRSISIKRYFDEMELPEFEKRDRKEFAKKLEEELFFILAMIYLYLETNGSEVFDRQPVKETLQSKILELLKEFTYPDSWMLGYAFRFSSFFVDSTIRNYESANGDENKSYWFSEDRARYNAENETNTIFNYNQYREATAEGFTQKQWITMKDERVRPSHAHVDDVVIGIDELFQVGEYLMRYPKDTEYGAGPEEIAGCRCTVVYF